MAIGTIKDTGKVALPACVAVKTMDFSAVEMENLGWWRSLLKHASLGSASSEIPHGSVVIP